MINVAIVEDNETIRNGLKEFLNDTNEYNCIAEFSDCESLLEKLPGLQTDIVLMDIELPGISGIEGIKRIKETNDDRKVIILTIYSESENVFEALAAGAFGYLEKKTPPFQMLKMIGEVHNGKSFMNSFVARKVLDYFFNKKNSTGKNKEGLNERELEILNRLIEGNSPKAIADYFEISLDSVHCHFFDIYRKLHLGLEMNKSSLTG